MMEVIGDLSNFKGALRCFFHCEVKEAPVICFEFDDTSLSQNLVIPSEIFGGGEAASGMSFLGPGIGKVEIDFFYLPFRKIGVDQLRVSADKKQVLKLQFLLFFQASQKNAGILFYAYIVDLRMLLSKLHDKAAFSGSNFQMERSGITEYFFPGSAVLFRFLYDPGAGSDRVARAGYIS